MRAILWSLTPLFLVVLGACESSTPTASPTPATPTSRDYVGTVEPFATDAIYFVLTDRFVNGDPGNDHRDQGGDHPSFDLPVPGPNGELAHAGYLGGDFRGLLDNADYISDMGFGAVWVTPIVDNPDQAFSGGDPVVWGGAFTDQGKSGFHGYWGVNFYRLDEHLPSADLDFAGLTAGLRSHGLKTVLDIVCNHGSPAYSMPVEQPMFGKVYDAADTLVADHQNLPPDQLKPATNPLHAFYNTGGGLAQLSDFNENNPAVMDYLVGAYDQWLGQGAAAIRIDTFSWMPDSFWREFARRLRLNHPDVFLFGEDFDDKADAIAHHTWPDGGSISVLDFPLRSAMLEVFGTKQAGYEKLAQPLYLDDGPYANPYDLVTFYDNHDMPRIDATDDGFIDAHNWLFTARGIPAIYYGSESGFMRGRGELQGNRNYFGEAGIAAAREHPIRRQLIPIAQLRQQLPALQRGLQINLELAADRAAFYRVLQHDGVSQLALVLLNKGDVETTFRIDRNLQAGHWQARLGGSDQDIPPGGALVASVAAHGVQVYVLDAPISEPGLIAAADAQLAARHRRTAE